MIKGESIVGKMDLDPLTPWREIEILARDSRDANNEESGYVQRETVRKRESGLAETGDVRKRGRFSASRPSFLCRG